MTVIFVLANYTFDFLVLFWFLKAILRLAFSYVSIAFNFLK